MIDHINEIRDGLRGYDTDSMVPQAIENLLRNMANKLSVIRRGWETWEKAIPDDLEWHRMSKEQLYELVVEDYLTGQDMDLMWFLTHNFSIQVRTDIDGVHVTAMTGTEATYSVRFHNLSVTYEDHTMVTSKTRRLDAYATPHYEDHPSF